MAEGYRATDLLVFEHFFAQERGTVHNPADVAKVRRWPKLSRPGAAASMERLARHGHLKMIERRARNQKGPTPHYQLAEDDESIDNTLRTYLSLTCSTTGTNIDQGLTALLASKFATRAMTPDFVMRHLAERMGEVSFYVPDEEGFVPPNREVVGEVPENFPHDLFKNMETAHPRGHAEVTPHATIDGTARALMQAQISSFDGGARSPSRDEARGMVLARLVIPFHALIHASTAALQEFLTDWEPTEEHTVSTLATVKHVIFRLIFAALDQTARTRRAPVYGDEGVFRIEVGGGPAATDSRWPLLYVSLSGGLDVAYSANFDTDEMVYGDELVIVKNGPEDAFVSVWYGPYIERKTWDDEDPRSELAKAVHLDPEWQSERFPRLL